MAKPSPTKKPAPGKPPTKATKAKPAKAPPVKLSEVETLRAQVLKLTDECTALREKDRREKQAAGEVRSCESDVEACKSETAAAKQRLADANKKLAAIVWGDAQQSHPALTPVEQAAQANTPPKRYDLPVDQVLAVEDDPATFAGRIVAAIAQADKPTKIGKELVHDFFGMPYLIRQGWPEVNPHKFFLQPLRTKDEYQQLDEKRYGRPVDGFDQNDEARQDRQRGGADCGRVVKIGQKTFVLGPESAGLVLACPEPAVVAVAGTPPADPPVSGKDAAAGKEPEELGPVDVDEDDDADESDPAA